jgi:hypothetical protein
VLDRVENDVLPLLGKNSDLLALRWCDPTIMDSLAKSRARALKKDVRRLKFLLGFTRPRRNRIERDVVDVKSAVKRLSKREGV